MSRSRLLALAASASLLAVVSGTSVLAQDLPPPKATPNPVPLDVPAGDGTGVRIKTDEGDIVIGLFTESAPVASENFTNLVEAGYYDGLGFHRIVEDFVIQGGDPAGDGTGGPGYTIPDEEVVGRYGRGIVAMARSLAPDSQGSQFFVVLDDAARPALESANTYVIFGRVIEGMGVVDAIAARGPQADVIEDPVVMRSVTIEQVELPPEPTLPPPTAAELAVAALTARMPAQVGELTLQTQVFPTEQLLSGPDREAAAFELAGIAEANAVTLADLVAVIGRGDDGESYVTVLGASMAGVPGQDMAETMTQLLLGDLPDAEVTQTSVAGRDVTSVKPTPDASPQDYVYVVHGAETVWYVVGDPASVEGVIPTLA